MTGIIRTTSFFRQELRYCLNDKLTPAREDGERQVLYRNRAEIIHYHQCYGNRAELVTQFREVAQINRNICEPYLHVMLGLPPQDRLQKSQWADLSVATARALDFERHQFVAIFHKDTDQQHVHLLVNRIGFSGEVVKDRYLLPRICQFCRQTEVDYRLTQIEGPRRYLTPEQRLAPRQDQRLARLKEAIGEVLKTACDYMIFKAEMEQRGYRVYRNERGIAFHEERMVIYRGSLAGYPLKKIEQQLEVNATLRQEQKQLLQIEEQRQQLLQRPEQPRLYLHERDEHVQRQRLRMKM